MFSKGRSTLNIKELRNKVSDYEILNYYIGIKEVPCVINSPLREDKKPSFGIYSIDGNKIYYTDFSTKDRGSIIDLLSKLWNYTYNETLEKIYNDLIEKREGKTDIKTIKITNTKISKHNENTQLKCRIREWKKHDIEYWESYGVSLKWLKFAEVYPISHKIIIKNKKKYIFSADKYAYSFVEHKEGNTTIKIYQPFNKKGFKWSNKHDSSVISLWTKIPKKGNILCICSSLKDALCLWANTGIPCISLQGEGYNISQTAISELRKRFNNIYILFDNDKAGIENSNKLSKETNFINLILPYFNEGKDISDLYFILKNKEKFREVILPLFNNNKNI